MHSSIALRSYPLCRKPHPSSLWRLQTVEQFSRIDILEIRRALQRISVNDERWSAASEGHAVSAISMMIAEWPVRSISARIDALMTAVVLAALTGSGAAALVAYHTMLQLVARQPAFRPIVTSWSATLEEREARKSARFIAPCRHRRWVYSPSPFCELNLSRFASDVPANPRRTTEHTI